MSTKADMVIKINLEVKIEILKDVLKNYDNPDIIFDVVVFNNESDWKVVVDVDESDDLQDELLEMNLIVLLFSFFLLLN